MPSQDFRDIVAIKATAQDQVAVLNEELAVSRSETAEAMELYELEVDLNGDLVAKNKSLAREVVTWKIVAAVAVASHAFR